MKCVVTGGAGFIGSNLVDRLIDDDHEVIKKEMLGPSWAPRKEKNLEISHYHNYIDEDKKIHKMKLQGNPVLIEMADQLPSTTKSFQLITTSVDYPRIIDQAREDFYCFSDFEKMRMYRILQDNLKSLLSLGLGGVIEF